MKYVWKTKNDGWNCKNLYMGEVKVGGYHRLIYTNPDGLYCLTINLPGIAQVYNDDPEILMRQAIDLCNDWLNKINKG